MTVTGTNNLNLRALSSPPPPENTQNDIITSLMRELGKETPYIEEKYIKFKAIIQDESLEEIHPFILQLAKEAPKKSSKASLDSIEETFGKWIQDTNKYASFTIGQLFPLLEIDLISPDWPNRFKTAEFFFNAGNTVTKGGILLAKFWVLHQLKAQLTNEQVQNSLTDDQLREITDFISEREKALLKELSSFAITESLKLPNAIKKATDLFAALDPLVKSGLGWVAGVCSVILSARKIAQAKKEQKIIEETDLFSTTLRNKHGVAWSAEALLKKREEAFQKLVEEKRGAFDPIWDSLLKEIEEATSVKEIEQLLKTQHISIDLLKEKYKEKELVDSLENERLSPVAREMKSVELQQLVNAFKQTIKNDSKIKEHALNAWVKHLETLSTATKNGIRALVANKGKIERGVINHSYKEKLGYFFVSLGYLALTTVAIVLGISGGLALALSGIGLFALGTAIMLYGFYHQLKHKPHLFWCYMTAKQIKISLYSIPLAWHKYRAEKTMVKGLKTLKNRIKLQKMDDLNEKQLKALAKEFSIRTKKTAEIKENMQQRIDKYLKTEKKCDEKIKTLHKKISGWLDKKTWYFKGVSHHKRELREAAAKDFARATRLSTLLKRQTGENPTYTKESFDIAEEIAEVISNNLREEPEIRTLLNKRLGITIEGDETDESLVEKIKDYFKMEKGSLIQFIQQQAS